MKKLERKFWDVLRPDDKSDLKRVLEVMKKEKLDVIAVGGAAVAAHEGRIGDYRDVDLLVRGDKEGYFRAKDKVNRLDIQVHGMDTHPYGRQSMISDRAYMGNIDVTYVEGRKIQDPGQSVDLVINLKYRE